MNNNILQGKQKIYVSLSLAAPHEEWASKLVAGIIFDDTLNFNQRIKPYIPPNLKLK